MGWLIALGIIGGYGGIGMLCVPFIARRRLAAHREGYRCEGCPSYYRDRDERTYLGCSASWASYAWLFWPVCLMIGYPKVIATGALAKDVEKAARLKVLEAEAAEQEKRVQRELAILRGNDPLTMTKADFDRKMLDAVSKPDKIGKKTLAALHSAWKSDRV